MTFHYCDGYIDGGYVFWMTLHTIQSIHVYVCRSFKGDNFHITPYILLISGDTNTIALAYISLADPISIYGVVNSCRLQCYWHLWLLYPLSRVC